ncbi:metal ABC transporter permease [Bremerella sp. P1]|uniref:metal ABC transporter permease n=1 Tax=Bremerella sp. P1 TaxID=3026424 RepID=UPI0023677E77|nr:iron chelate uptake ABC transporter family permease subunit [Bremerella sp. P1]WDI41857.1 iron chelate uptake ABC transporter family permease subunit [Bremerella sp. P1]
MDAFYTLFVEPFQGNSYLLRAVVAGCLVAISAGVVGCLIILRRMAFLGDAISHSMLAGVTGGYLLMKVVYGHEAHFAGMILGALIAGFTTVLLVSFVSRVSRIKEDTAIGIMYTGIFALGGALASMFSHYIHLDLFHFVMGDVLAVDAERLWMMAGVTAVVLFVTILWYRQLLLTSFDPIMAASIGLPVLLIHMLMTTCTSLVVVSAVQIVGVILVVGLLITPAATAYLLTNRLSHMMALSALFGISSVVCGVYLSVWLNVATSPPIVLFSTFQFMVVLVFSPRFGLLSTWIRKRAAIPHTLAEDILGCMRRNEGLETSLATIIANVPTDGQRLRRTLDGMVTRGLIQPMENDAYQLTEAGELEARRLMRAHRIWEAYLARLGMPEEEIHDRAHLLEHVNDEAAVDYLDDRLGHPITDPHGQEIPEDFLHLVPGHEVPASLLREGHVAEVMHVEPEGSFDLTAGDRLITGPRTDNEQTWTFQVNDGQRQLDLDHHQADSITVRLLDTSQAQN